MSDTIHELNLDNLDMQTLNSILGLIKSVDNSVSKTEQELEKLKKSIGNELTYRNNDNMFCYNCNERAEFKYCAHCGAKQFRKSSLDPILKKLKKA